MSVFRFGEGVFGDYRNLIGAHERFQGTGEISTQLSGFCSIIQYFRLFPLIKFVSDRAYGVLWLLIAGLNKSCSASSEKLSNRIRTLAY